MRNQQSKSYHSSTPPTTPPPPSGQLIATKANNPVETLQESEILHSDAQDPCPNQHNQVDCLGREPTPSTSHTHKDATQGRCQGCPGRGCPRASARSRQIQSCLGSEWRGCWYGTCNRCLSDFGARYTARLFLLLLLFFFFVVLSFAPCGLGTFSLGNLTGSQSQAGQSG